MGNGRSPRLSRTDRVRFVKYGRLTSYHTRLMSLTAYVMGGAAVAFFAGWSDLPLRAACVVLLVAGAEEILSSATLPAWQANVRDLRDAYALRARTRAAAT